MGNNDWLDIDVLDDYLEGKLDASTMHKVERISLDDPFVAQALAGLTEAKKRTQTLSLLQKQLQERVAQKPIERKMWRLTSHRLSIAATAAVVFIAVGILFWLRESNRRQQAELAANKPKSIEVLIKPEAAATSTATDTLSKAETLIAKQKIEKVLDGTLTNGKQALAKNKPVTTQAVEKSVLQEKEFANAKLKKELTAQQQAVMVDAKSAPLAPPRVQMLDSKVDGIQVQTSNAKVYKGLVLDVNGRPIPGAEIKMVGDDLRAITNVSGEFALPANKDSNKVTLEVASLGFASKNVQAKTNEKLNIRLEENSSALNEVALVGYGAKKKLSTADEAVVGVPKVGWKAYNEYLMKENKLYVDGSKTVTLNFTVLPDGSPSEIKVVLSAGKAFDEEATRLLKNGSKWNYSDTANKNTAISIKF